MNHFISRKVVVSCFLAGCLEIYDFTIFGFFTAILHKNYFIFLEAKDALIVTYMLFAVGFLFRPVGSIIFGYIGDKFGRKKSLVLSVTLMGTASLGMFVLPPYSIIGASSCYLIVLIRILQGISVGGEYSGAIIYAIEHFNKKSAGLIGGIVVSGCLLGVMLARLVSTIFQNPDLPDYSWRFAFLLGFGLSLIGFFIRSKLTESPEFLANKKIKIPLFEGMKNYPLEMVAVILLVGANGVNLYFVAVFLPEFLKNNNGLDIGYNSLIATIIPAFLAPIIGWLSDKTNRAKVLLCGVGLMGVYNIICLPVILQITDPLNIVILILGYATLFAIQSGTLNTFSVEIFPAKYRYSCGAFCYAVGMALIGGTSPMVATLLTTKGNINYVVFYIVFITVLGFIGGSLVVFKSFIWKKNEVIDIPVS